MLTLCVSLSVTDTLGPILMLTLCVSLSLCYRHTRAYPDVHAVRVPVSLLLTH